MKSQSASVLACVSHAVSHTNRPWDLLWYLLNHLSWLNWVHSFEALLDPRFHFGCSLESFFFFILLTQELWMKRRVTRTLPSATSPPCLEGSRCRWDGQKGARSLTQTVQWKSTLSHVTCMSKSQCSGISVFQTGLDSNIGEQNECQCLSSTRFISA